MLCQSKSPLNKYFLFREAHMSDPNDQSTDEDDEEKRDEEEEGEGSRGREQVFMTRSNRRNRKIKRALNRA